jgi:hypothetical protein
MSHHHHHHEGEQQVCRLIMLSAVNLDFELFTLSQLQREIREEQREIQAMEAQMAAQQQGMCFVTRIWWPCNTQDSPSASKKYHSLYFICTGMMGGPGMMPPQSYGGGGYGGMPPQGGYGAECTLLTDVTCDVRTLSSQEWAAPAWLRWEAWPWADPLRPRRPRRAPMYEHSDPLSCKGKLSLSQRRLLCTRTPCTLASSCETTTPCGRATRRTTPCARRMVGQAPQ